MATVVRFMGFMRGMDELYRHGISCPYCQHTVLVDKKQVIGRHKSSLQSYPASTRVLATCGVRSHSRVASGRVFTDWTVNRATAPGAMATRAGAGPEIK